MGILCPAYLCPSSIKYNINPNLTFYLFTPSIFLQYNLSNAVCGVEVGGEIVVKFVAAKDEQAIALILFAYASLSSLEIQLIKCF